MTDTNTLAPCPFCGERAETDFIPEHHSYQIECSDSIGCTARITRDSELGAIEAWNCRAALAAPAQPIMCQPPKSWNKRGQDAYRRGWEDRGNSVTAPRRAVSRRVPRWVCTERRRSYGGAGMNFLMGVWFGSVMAVAIQVMLNDKPRTLCEASLPREERCVKQWVPPQPQGKGTNAN